ncbi:MAG: cytochrome c oxidase assembly factor Coa1 family protein [Planctomycetota bacterium]|jgi:hypothetical protein
MDDFANSQGTSADKPVGKPQRGWLGRNWLWFVPTALLGLAALCGGFWLGIRLAPEVALKWSQAYAMALQRVQDDPQIIERLGQPIEESGWLPRGEISLQNGRGDANFHFDVAGPNGQAEVHTQARRVAGRWGLSRLEVTITDDDQRIVLDVSDEQGPDGAPRFEP